MTYSPIQPCPGRCLALPPSYQLSATIFEPFKAKSTPSTANLNHRETPCNLVHLSLTAARFTRRP